MRIESDPNAEGFYLRMGARRIGIKAAEVDGVQRELPVLVYEVGREPSGVVTDTGSAQDP